MHITEILKTVMTTIDGLIAILFLAGSIRYSKKESQATCIAFLALFALMVVNTIMMWM